MDALRTLADALSGLPGIGRRSAERIATYLARHPDDRAAPLLSALTEARAQLTACGICGSVTTRTQNPCALCSSPTRNPALLCIVEDPADIPLLERSGAFNGRYFSLMGKLSPMRGQGLSDLRFDALKKLVAAANVTEVLLALNADVESDATASFLRYELLRLFPRLRISRLAWGLPAGSAIAYSDPVTLGRAIKGRTAL